MKALIVGLALLVSGSSTPQALHPRQRNTKSQCATILKFDSIVYAKTKDETIDSVTVCDDGKATAFHSFTAPAFGSAQPEPTKWDYSGEIDKDALSDLKKIMRRTDIARLPERVNAIKTHSPVDVLMHFTILDQGTERTITLNVPSLGCGEDRRALPMTSRVRMLLESRWEGLGRPIQGFVWPAPSKSGHLEPSSLKKQHSKALRLSNMRPFVLYSLRHTFLTRLGGSGCDAWMLARIAGHSSVAISARYVHPSEDAVLAAMARLSGHKIGHSAEIALNEQTSQAGLSD